MPRTRPPRSCAPRLAASITPKYPPVQIVKPASAKSCPARRASAYSAQSSLHFEPPKIVTIRSCVALVIADSYFGMIVLYFVRIRENFFPFQNKRSSVEFENKARKELGVKLSPVVSIFCVYRV